MRSIHQAVLLDEIINYLNVRQNQNYIDATVDGAAVAEAILERNGPQGRLLGFDFDPEMVKVAQERLSRFQKRSLIVHSNFVDLAKVAMANKFENVQGIIFDLGVSTFHFQLSGRGFTFQKNEPLDMRFNPKEQKLTAREIVNTYAQERLATLLKDYGQERYARKIAKAIVEYRKSHPINTTTELVRIILEIMPRSYLKQKIHSATRTFQALRIAVNHELENLQIVLPQAFEILVPGGRLVVISFHSLEDGIVKKFFQGQRNSSKILTPKPITPTKQDIANNPKARSAKLRALQKTYPHIL